MAKKLAKEYVFEPGLGLNDNARPNAYSLITSNRLFIIKEISAYIQNQVDAGNPDYTGKTYNIAKCERDAGYVIDALLFDLRYNGNEETRRISTYYWDEDVPQIQGNRIAEIDSYTYVIDLINTYILTNTELLTPQQETAIQVINDDLTTETGTDTRVSSLLGDLISVIDLGLDELPALNVGLGRIELLGKIGLQDLLIITNVTNNTVMYNFAEPTKGGRVVFTEGNSEAYPQAEAVNNGTTIINFNYNTASMSNTDEIQVFLEETELSVRLNDIANDAMERVKVGIPQAMLDADFEYGLQPTKWQAIGTLRGYPSTYEIPASDVSVLQVNTDASTGTGGVGASLITVSTNGPHGLTQGQPFTIRALASSTIGFNRAEGTFIVQQVVDSETFTYYAKSKVGTTAGQVLATQNTQLRKADFYTGSNISTPTFTVVSQGGSGSFTTSLGAVSGTTTLSFKGSTTPPINVPITGTGIASGTQVTAVFGTATASGIQATPYVEDNFLPGETSISVVDTTGITTGMTVSDGGTQRVITSIQGNILNLNGPINAEYIGDTVSYANIILSSSNYIVGTGTGATFNITATDNGAGTIFYTNIQVNNSGSGYLAGDTLLVLGSAVGGTIGADDILIVVDSVTGGAITAVRIISDTDLAPAAGTFNDVSSSQTSNTLIENAAVTILKDAGTYAPVFINNPGGFIFVGNRFLLSGDIFDGFSPANDIILTVTAEDEFLGGGMDNFTVSGTAERGDTIDIYAAINISQPTTQNILSNATINYSGIPEIEVEFPSFHGLLPGSSVLIGISSNGTNHSIAGGPFFIQKVPTPTTIRYNPRTNATIDVSTDDLEGIVYPRPDAFFSHRPFDGGVQLGTGGPQHGAQAIRMSKKYIRYQSGKGAMYNTGALFAPSFDISSMTATATTVGSIITINCDDSDHGLQSGARIKISGSKTVGYDGDYTVNEIIDERTFTVVATTALGSTTATIGSQCQMALLNWHGATVRSGCYDEQNGIFWQYDGQEMAVGRRSATFQIAGTISIASDSNTVTGTNTRFLDQLQEGDRVVIKGMTHVVSRITSNTVMYITPGFRGVSNISGAKAALIQDIIIPQSEWNLDRCDGTGPSGYNIDVTKMQMIGIQFTWYGAGFVDWMLRGPDGSYIFCHRLKGNNLNTEAYMRTGNLPVRYEVINEGGKDRLAEPITASTTDIPLEDASHFPSSGTVIIDNEIITYTGKVGNTLAGATRAAQLQNFAGGSTRTYTAGAAATHSDRQGVILLSSTTSPIISHWGSAYLIDGQFDDDRGYLFSYPVTNLEISGIKNTAFLIRLAPSVSNAIVGDLGERELLNRAQLLLNDVSVVSDGSNGTNPILGGIVVEGILNPQNYPLDPDDIEWNGLNNQAAGGQPSFAQIALGSSVNWAGGGQTITSTATISGAVTQTQTILAVFNKGRSINDGNDRVYIAQSAFASSGLAIGDTIDPAGPNGSAFPSGTRITSIVQNWDGNPWARLNLSNDATSNVSGESTMRFIAQNTAASYTNSNRLVFTDASWTASGAIQGTKVDTAVTTQFPVNSLVQSVASRTFGGTVFYIVAFTQSFSGTLNAAGTVGFDFSQPPYAQPGETVFSFIAQPGERSELDLSQLKELTTTTLGGRGAFPNGPDVLAINVYKTSGATTNATVLLRWGEAQA